MASLYVHGQLIATNEVHGILGNNLIHDKMVITYDNRKSKFYTVIIYDVDHIHHMIINVKGDDFLKGDTIVDFVPFDLKHINYDIIIGIYEQPRKLPLPEDDFDMELYAQQYKLQLLYTIEFTVLRHITIRQKKQQKMICDICF